MTTKTKPEAESMIRIDVYHHFPPFDAGATARIESSLLNLTEGQRNMTATMQQVLNDLDEIKQKSTDYIAARDAIDVQLRADLAAATAAAGISPAEQADIDSAFTKAEEAKALLTPPAPTGTGPT